MKQDEFYFGIVLINYNNSKDTIECLNSLFQSEYHHFRIYIVDNSPTLISYDEIIIYLKERNINYSTDLNNNENKVIITKQENKGFSAANNVVLKTNNNNIDFYWILNNDTIVPKDFLLKLNKKLIDEKEKIKNTIYSNALLYYQTNIIQAMGGKCNIKFGSTYHCYLDQEYVKNFPYSQDIDYPIGASIILHNQVLKKIGLMSEEYFLYYEELDWMQKAKQKNINLTLFSDLAIEHKGGGTIGEKSKKTSFNQIYYLHRSRQIWLKKFYKKNYFFGKIYTFLIFIKYFRHFKYNDNIKFLKLLKN